MKPSFVCVGWAAMLVAGYAQTTSAPESSSTPRVLPPVYPGGTAQTSNGQIYIYDQKPMAGRPPFIVSPEQAQSIITRFKDEYKRIGNPRVLVVINRDLLDGSFVPGASPARAERVGNTNLSTPKELTVADRQTARDLERLFGRPLRMAGVQLVDEHLANQVLSGNIPDSLAVEAQGDRTRRQREALAKIADVALEILVSSKEVPVAELAGDATYMAPDLHVTAIRLSDSHIVGQATAADLIGTGAAAGRAMRIYGIREIAEATALSLMEDMMLSSGDRAAATP